MSIRIFRARARRAARAGAALAGATLLAACAHFSPDGGFDAVARTAEQRIGHTPRWNRTAEEQARASRDTAQLLARPLSADDAVEIALLNNGSLQASFAELGIAEADVVQSGRLPNPRFTLRHAGAQGVYDIEETVSVSLLAVVSAPYVHRVEKHRFAEVQARCAADIVQVAARTREAYFIALAARDSARYRQEVDEAAETGAELARRMRVAGNWSALDEARERSFHEEAALELARARLAEAVARESLIESLGVGLDPAELKLAERLPDVPTSIEALPDVERTALDNRIDLKAMRAHIEALAQQLHLSRATRFVNVLEAGPTRVKQGSSAEPYETGYEVSLEVPLFDSGGPRVERARLAMRRRPSVSARRRWRRAPSAQGLRPPRAAHDVAVASGTRWCRCASRSRSRT